MYAKCGKTRARERARGTGRHEARTGRPTAVAGTLAGLIVSGCSGGAPDAVAESTDPLGARCNEAQIFAPGEITVPGTSVSRISVTPDGKTAK